MTSGTRPIWSTPAFTRWTARATCAMSPERTSGCAGWWRTTRARCSRPSNAACWTSLQAEFPQEAAELRQALTYCDMTTGPDGTHLHVADRLAEIHSRYGPGHLVSRSIANATPVHHRGGRARSTGRLADVRAAGIG